MPPGGALEFPPRFRCRCGQVLNAPRNNLVVTRSATHRSGSVRSRSNRDVTAPSSAPDPPPAAKPITRNDLNLDELDNIIAENADDDMDVGRDNSMWTQCISTHDNRVKWITSDDQSVAATQSGAAVAMASGADTDIAAAESTVSLSVGWVRAFKNERDPEAYALEWRAADVGYIIRGDISELPRVSKEPFGKKLKWFRKQIEKLKVPWEKGHQKIKVRRSNLLEDATAAFMKVKGKEFGQIFRFSFEGEPALDAGGVAREWYEQLTKTLFDLNFGLFCVSSDNQGLYQINRLSGIANGHHLVYFRFAGRMMAKALFDGQLIKPHLVRPFYKHIIGVPMCLGDSQYINRELHDNWVKMLEMEDVDDLCLDFTITRESFGQTLMIELKEGGEDIEVDDDNKHEYIALLLEDMLFKSIKDQLEQFLRGFYEVIPHSLVCVFDYQELELLLCGLPRIDIKDWQANTRYAGDYSKDHQVVQWFFEVMDTWTGERKARLLQFATGSSHVPVEGFRAMQSHDGKLCRFCLKSISRDHAKYPIAHTCFNRLDIPMYETKAELATAMSTVIDMEVCGFGLE